MAKQITVRELIALLEKAPQDLPVSVEGCDCYQKAAAVRVFSDVSRYEKPYVLITNTKSEVV